MQGLKNNLVISLRFKTKFYQKNILILPSLVQRPIMKDSFFTYSTLGSCMKIIEKIQENFDQIDCKILVLKVKQRVLRFKSLWFRIAVGKKHALPFSMIILCHM